jgi:hypothetical protein
VHQIDAITGRNSKGNGLWAGIELTEADVEARKSAYVRNIPEDAASLAWPDDPERLF